MAGQEITEEGRARVASLEFAYAIKELARSENAELLLVISIAKGLTGSYPKDAAAFQQFVLNHEGEIDAALDRCREYIKFFNNQDNPDEVGQIVFEILDALRPAGLDRIDRRSLKRLVGEELRRRLIARAREKFSEA
jgi:hypothetical protein